MNRVRATTLKLPLLRYRNFYLGARSHAQDITRKPAKTGNLEITVYDQIVEQCETFSSAVLAIDRVSFVTLCSEVNTTFSRMLAYFTKEKTIRIFTTRKTVGLHLYGRKHASSRKFAYGKCVSHSSHPRKA